MADSHQKREELKNAYPKSQRWAHKVDKMSDEQVVAIHSNFRAQGKMGR